MVVQFSLFWGGISTNVIVPDDLISRLLQRKVQRWIPVQESLPDVGHPVLVKIPGAPHALVATRHSTVVWRFADSVTTGVTHWRSLPELP